MSAKRYKVTLTYDERQELRALVSQGKAAARKLTRARILLQADQGPNEPTWSDQKIVEALGTSRLSVERTRKTCVEDGIEAALNPKKRSRPGNQKFDGEKEAHLIAIACSKPPQGKIRWILKMLADATVERHHFDSICQETIR